MKATYLILGTLLIVALLTIPTVEEPLVVDTDAQQTAQKQEKDDRCTKLYGKYAMSYQKQNGEYTCINTK